MRVSVILSAYNQPDAIELALRAYAIQSFRDFEVVVADDGSSFETPARIEAVRADTGLEIRHVWQRDRGWRKCRVLNRAIVVAEGDYLVFSDGDCLPRVDYLEVHVGLATPGRFVSGGRCNLPKTIADDVVAEDVLEARVFDPEWWRIRGALDLHARLKLEVDPPFAGLMDRLTTTRATWNGHNASGWKADALAVNGFDERMTYPGEDREFGERLRNRGIRPIQARHRSVVVHLSHARRVLDPAVVRGCENLRRRTRGLPGWLSRWEGLVRGPTSTAFGIRQLEEPSLAAIASDDCA